MKSVSILDLNNQLTMCGSSNLSGDRLRNSSFKVKRRRRGGTVTALIRLLLLRRAVPGVYSPDRGHRILTTRAGADA